MTENYRVLFVCLGNICRSPMAEGILKHLAEKEDLQQIYIESAGTGNYHIGNLPDPRSVAVAMENGITLDQPARMFIDDDFQQFDMIVVMDESNYADVMKLQPEEDVRAEVVLMRSFDPESNKEMGVPDPYHGNITDFEEVYDILLRCNQALLKDLQKKLDERQL